MPARTSRSRHRLVPVNAPLPTFMRAPGEASGSFALESAIDELAVAVKVDPLAMRLLNYAETDLHEEKPFSSKSLRQCYAAGAEAFGWARRATGARIDARRRHFDRLGDGDGDLSDEPLEGERPAGVRRRW